MLELLVLLAVWTEYCVFPCAVPVAFSLGTNLYVIHVLIFHILTTSVDLNILLKLEGKSEPKVLSSMIYASFIFMELRENL